MRRIPNERPIRSLCNPSSCKPLLAASSGRGHHAPATALTGGFAWRYPALTISFRPLDAEKATRRPAGIVISAPVLGRAFGNARVPEQRELTTAEEPNVHDDSIALPTVMTDGVRAGQPIRHLQVCENGLAISPRGQNHVAWAGLILSMILSTMMVALIGFVSIGSGGFVTWD